MQGGQTTASRIHLMLEDLERLRVRQRNIGTYNEVHLPQLIYNYHNYDPVFSCLIEKADYCGKRVCSRKAPVLVISVLRNSAEGVLG